MIPYGIHVAILLAVCLLFYKLLLQSETYYRLNRLVLLGCLALAFILPLIPVPGEYSLRNSAPEIPKIAVSAPVAPVSAPSENITGKHRPANSNVPDQSVANEPDYLPVLMANVLKWAVWLYWAGVIIFFANLLLQLIVLIYQAYTKPVIRDGIYRIIELDTDKAPSSFGNNIFINPSKYDWDTYSQILEHEKVHSRQKHSIDLILAELVVVLQWFNPFAWLYRKELESNLEFLTDHEVLKNDQIVPEDYQMSLLKVSVPHYALRVSTSYNQSLLKKRILMMNARRSNIHILWKYFMLLPMAILLVCCLNKPIVINISNGGTADYSEPVTLSETTPAEGIPSESSRGSSAGPKVPVSSVSHPALTNSGNAVAMSTLATVPVKEVIIQKEPSINDIVRFKSAGILLLYISGLRDAGLEDLTFNSVSSLHSAGIKVDYVKELIANGVSPINSGIIREFKSSGILTKYVKDLKEAGITDLSFGSVRQFQSSGIKAEYVKGLYEAGIRDLSYGRVRAFQANGIKIDYVTGLYEAGIRDLSYDKARAFQANGIKLEYVKGLHDAGITDLSYDNVRAFQAAAIKAEYVKGLHEAGVSDLSYSNIRSLQSKGITADNLREFQASGIKAEPIKTSVSSDGREITPEFIRSLKDIGYRDTETSTLKALRSNGITADYIRSFLDINYSQTTPSDLKTMKESGITADYIRSFMDINFKEISISSLQTLKRSGITADYIRTFMDINYRDISISNLQKLKSSGITADFIRGYMDINYHDLQLKTLQDFKKYAITPDYIRSLMDADYKDLDISNLKLLKSGKK